MTAVIFQQWIDAKEAERKAVDERRHIEDLMIEAFDISDTLEGVQSIDANGYKVKVTGRMNRKVDGDKVQEIAAEHGLTEHLSTLFRWKPEMNMTAWKNTAEAITGPLLDGITTTPGRPSFNITIEEKE